MERGTIKLPRHPETELWPVEVDLILSAMEAGCEDANQERRYRHRLPYRVRAELRLFSDSPDAKPKVLYTRDVDARGLGFITPHRLPLGYGGVVELFAPRGRKLRIEGTLYRCRQCAHGWYEGAMSFHREQAAFDVEA